MLLQCHVIGGVYEYGRIMVVCPWHFFLADVLLRTLPNTGWLFECRSHSWCQVVIWLWRVLLSVRAWRLMSTIKHALSFDWLCRIIWSCTNRVDLQLRLLVCRVGISLRCLAIHQPTSCLALTFHRPTQCSQLRCPWALSRAPILVHRKEPVLHACLSRHNSIACSSKCEWTSQRDSLCWASARHQCRVSFSCLAVLRWLVPKWFHFVSPPGSRYQCRWSRARHCRRAWATVPTWMLHQRCHCLVNTSAALFAASRSVIFTLRTSRLTSVLLDHQLRDGDSFDLDTGCQRITFRVSLPVLAPTSRCRTTSRWIDFKHPVSSCNVVWQRQMVWWRRIRLFGPSFPQLSLSPICLRIWHPSMPVHCDLSKVDNVSRKAFSLLVVVGCASCRAGLETVGCPCWVVQCQTHDGSAWSRLFTGPCSQNRAICANLPL